MKTPKTFTYKRVWAKRGNTPIVGEVTFNVEKVEPHKNGTYFLLGEITKSTIDNQPVGCQAVTVATPAEIKLGFKEGDS
jgi:hypothetical protein